MRRHKNKPFDGGPRLAPGERREQRAYLARLPGFFPAVWVRERGGAGTPSLRKKTALTKGAILIKGPVSGGPGAEVG